MNKQTGILILVLIITAAAVLGCKNLKTPSAPAPTLPPTAVLSPTITPTRTPVIFTPTRTLTVTRTATRTLTSTAVPGTFTDTPTISPTSTDTPVLSPTPTLTITETATITVTPTVTITLTATVCATDTSLKLITTAGVRFQYRVINCGQTMECILSATGTGWVGVGWHGNTATSSGKGNNATLLIGYVSGGVPAMRDDFNTSSNTHVDDTTRSGGVNNISDLTGTESGGVTELRFTYPLNTGDPSDTPLVPGNFYNFLLAYHSTTDDFVTRHTSRGVVANTQF